MPYYRIVVKLKDGKVITSNIREEDLSLNTMQTQSAMKAAAHYKHELKEVEVQQLDKTTEAVKRYIAARTKKQKNKSFGPDQPWTKTPRRKDQGLKQEKPPLGERNKGTNNDLNPWTPD